MTNEEAKNKFIWLYESGFTREDVEILIDNIYKEFEKDIEYKNLMMDKIIEQHKLQIINLFNSNCSNCIYVNKINNCTFICNNKNSPLEDKITDKSFWCNLGRVKK